MLLNLDARDAADDDVAAAADDDDDDDDDDEMSVSCEVPNIPYFTKQNAPPKNAKMAQDGHKMVQDSPKIPLKCPPSAPRIDQEAFN